MYRRTAHRLLKQATYLASNKGPAAKSGLATLAQPAKASSSAANALVPVWRSVVHNAARPAGVSVRWYSRVDTDLVSTLDEELAHEEQQGVPKVEKPPAPFKLVDEPGTARLVLNSTHGKEEVEVVARIGNISAAGYDLNEALEDDESESTAEDAPANESVEFMVTVKKGSDPNSPALVFDCSASGSELRILQVSVEDTDADEESELYLGPEYEQLDPALQTNFEEYLGDRGVNAHFTSWLVGALQDKEQAEYVRWLQKVKDFVRK